MVSIRKEVSFMDALIWRRDAEERLACQEALGYGLIA
jgi:hypothetical protein